MIYRGYDIVKSKDHFTIMQNDKVIKTNPVLTSESLAMDIIDNIERERVKKDNANIQRVDNQIKRSKIIKSKSLFLNELEGVFKR